MCGIYKITNQINKKAYIGQAVDIRVRFNGHRSTAFNPNDNGYEYPLYRAIRKYGIDNFTFEVLEECLVSELNEKEIYYIALYDTYYNGYNQDKGGTSASHFTKLSDELVDEIIAILKISKENSDTIGEKFGVCGSTIRKINTGESCYRDTETYPIRQPIYISERPGNFCISCGVPIDRSAKRHCVKCSQLAQRRAERPEPLELARMVTEIGFRNVGDRYCVSDKAIVNWCKQYGIPHKRKELEKWYRQQIGEPEPEPKTKIDQRMPVDQIDPNTNKVVAVFESTNAAARAFDKKKGTRISDACKNGTIVYGYLWRFASTHPTQSQPNS